MYMISPQILCCIVGFTLKYCRDQNDQIWGWIVVVVMGGIRVDPHPRLTLRMSEKPQRGFGDKKYEFWVITSSLVIS